MNEKIMKIQNQCVSIDFFFSDDLEKFWTAECVLASSNHLIIVESADTFDDLLDSLIVAIEMHKSS